MNLEELIIKLEKIGFIITRNDVNETSFIYNEQSIHILKNIKEIAYNKIMYDIHGLKYDFLYNEVKKHNIYFLRKRTIQKLF